MKLKAALTAAAIGLGLWVYRIVAETIGRGQD